MTPPGERRERGKRRDGEDGAGRGRPVPAHDEGSPPPAAAPHEDGGDHDVPPAVSAFADGLGDLPWVRDLLVAGSLATGDHVPGVSDLDLVAIVDAPLDTARTHRVVGLHRALDRGAAEGADLGCVYVAEDERLDVSVRHPTWTHGDLVERILSGVTRAELVHHGFAVFGREPCGLFPPMSDDDVRAAARAELCGYWTWAARRPHLWRSPTMVDLGLTSMARGRHALATGTLLTKSAAVEQADSPAWLVEQLRARRRGRPVTSPRLRSGWIAWRDAVRTTAAARRS